MGIKTINLPRDDPRRGQWTCIGPEHHQFPWNFGPECCRRTGHG
jgi:hypothetical protein